MRSFEGRLAVVTGGGSGMGRELAVQLAGQGCAVATCDVNEAALAETLRRAEEAATDDTRVTTHRCDVSDESQVMQFRDEVVAQHGTGHVDLVVNNAGIAAGNSFVCDSRADWERTFAVCWGGVYNCSRAFLPLLLGSEEGWLVNVSSVNGFLAVLAPGVPHTAYSAAKFAVKGFSEALLEDFRVNAPHLRVAVVMPGHIGTDIIANSRRAIGDSGREVFQQVSASFRDNAPLSAAEAATIILDGVRVGSWRILVGDDAYALDAAVRANPEAAYGPAGLSLDFFR